MIVQDEFLKKVRSAFSLNIYEAKIWSALLSKGVATAGELSDMSNVPRSRSYDVLESLEKRGFIIMKLGRPIKYLAIKPEEIFKRVKKGLQEKAERDIVNLDKVQKTDVFGELNLLFKQGIENIDPTSIAGAFRGRSNIYDHILTLFDGAEKSVIISTTDTGILRKLEIMKTTFRKLNQRGVQLRIAAPLKVDKSKKAAKELSEFAKVGASSINSRFVVIDNKDVVIMVNNDKDVHESYEHGIWVNSPFFANTLTNYFNANWEK